MAAAFSVVAGCAACGSAAASPGGIVGSAAGPAGDPILDRGRAGIGDTASPAPAPAPAHATIGPIHVETPHFHIVSDTPTEEVTSPLLIHPGKSTGWHTHPGPVFVIVTGGRLTRYEVGRDGTCTPTTFGPGQGFVELPGVVHIGRNEGTTDVTGYSTYLNVPAGTVAFKTLVSQPAGCPGIS